MSYGSHGLKDMDRIHQRHQLLGNALTETSSSNATCAQQLLACCLERLHGCRGCDKPSTVLSALTAASKQRKCCSVLERTSKAQHARELEGDIKVADEKLGPTMKSQFVLHDGARRAELPHVAVRIACVGATCSPSGAGA